MIRKEGPGSDAVDIGLWLAHRVYPLYCINNIVITVVNTN